MGGGGGKKEMKVGEEVLGSSLHPNICQTSTHTHLGNQIGAMGPVATAGACLLGSVDCRLLRLEEEEPSKSGWC